jgi:uncharacterized protein Yka (UPF0111/DUF47 family)
MAKKKFDYFNYFKDISDIICEAAQHLYKTLHSFNSDNLKENLNIMHEIEHKADCSKHEMMKFLVHEFITPIEREDIVSLAQCLDSVVDTIEDVLLRIYMFNVSDIRRDALSFSDIVVKCTEELNYVLSEFKNFKNSDKIKEAIVSVNDYESNGDSLLVNGIRELSDTGVSDREFFIWTDVLEHLEECLDSCEDAADIIEEVIMKNS